MYSCLFGHNLSLRASAVEVFITEDLKVLIIKSLLQQLGKSSEEGFSCSLDLPITVFTPI